MALQRIVKEYVKEYGVDNVGALLDAMIAQEGRRELIERRASDTRDAWKVNMRPMTAATTAELAPLATSDERRRAPRYRRHREEEIDAQIRKQARDRELEDGLAVILERQERMPGYRNQVAEIVDRVEAGQSVAQIAQEMVIHTSTVERRLRDIREAATVSDEVAQLSNPCPLPGLNEGRGPRTPVRTIKGEKMFPRRPPVRKVNHFIAALKSNGPRCEREPVVLPP
jgi:hypothetical protein